MEIKLIVDNAIDELRNRGLDSMSIDRAISYWSEVSGIDIRTIDENTPFDIDIVNKLLSTFPNVISKINEFKEEKIDESLEKELEMLMNVLSGTEEIEEFKAVDEELEKELQKLAFSLVEEQKIEERLEAKVSEIKGIRLAAIINAGKIEKFLVSKETEYSPNLNRLIETISNIWSLVGLNLYDFDSFHVKLGALTLYIEKRENKIYLVLVETETVGGAKFFVYGLARA